MGNKEKNVPAETIQEAQRLRYEGKTIKQVVELTGLSEWIIQTRTIGKQSQVAENLDKIRQLRAKGYTGREIAEQLGMHITYIAHICADYKIPKPTKASMEARRGLSELDKPLGMSKNQKHKWAYERACEGYYDDEIGDVLGVTAETIARWRKADGTYLPNRRKYRGGQGW